MAKEIVKKTKIKFFNLLIFLVIILGFVFATYLYLQIPVKNIIIRGTKYLNDDYILDLANIKDYPSYYKFSKKKIAKNIHKSEYVNNVIVKRKFFNTFDISIEEKKALFYRNSDQRFIFNDKSSVEKSNSSINFCVPRLLNYVPNNIYDNFVKDMNKVNEDVLSRISEIVYDPNDIDKERFLLYMDDGNMVYVTLTKFKAINYYNSVVEQLENRKGILYLDNGNHFQIKE